MLSKPVRNLLDYSALKSLAEKVEVERIDRRHNVVHVKFHQQTRVQPEKLMELVRGTKGAQFSPAGILMVPLDGGMGPGEILGYLGELLSETAGGL